MSRRKPKILFDNYSLWNLNPNNYALKNDFVENLIYTGSMVLPLATALTNSGLEVKILKCFEPKSVDVNADKFEKYLWSGQGIKLGIYHDAIALTGDEIKENILISNFLDSQIEDYFSIIIYKDSLLFIQNGKHQLIEVIDSKDRVIR